jgi:hypothetical protein
MISNKELSGSKSINGSHTLSSIIAKRQIACAQPSHLTKAGEASTCKTRANETNERVSYLVFDAWGTSKITTIDRLENELKNGGRASAISAQRAERFFWAAGPEKIQGAVSFRGPLPAYSRPTPGLLRDLLQTYTRATPTALFHNPHIHGPPTTGRVEGLWSWSFSYISLSISLDWA